MFTRLEFTFLFKIALIFPTFHLQQRVSFIYYVMKELVEDLSKGLLTS